MGMATHIIDWLNDSNSSSQASVKIESYPWSQRIGFVPYAKFIVYPNKNLRVVADIGTVAYIETVRQKIKAEPITFSGTEASAAFRIQGNFTIDGNWFDGLGNAISPSFSIKNGAIVSTMECYGKGFISYDTSGKVYYYSALIEGTVTTVGTVYAFDPDKKGVAASFDIPLIDTSGGGGDYEEMLVVYRETITQDNKTFEKPENWDTSNAYANYSGALTSQKPNVAKAYVTNQERHKVIFAEGFGIFNGYVSVRWHDPTATNTPFNGAKYKLIDNIPASPTDTITAIMIDELNSRKAALYDEFPGLE